ncbi:sensor histidine kinase [Roseomonas elaeocarpi]|uniref:histidine kinase n=1 Tax=Roseomonas elaeocarpi TaxID=907779 RepID=A0ABV6JWU7_9PROT
MEEAAYLLAGAVALPCLASAGWMAWRQRSQLSALQAERGRESALRAGQARRLALVSRELSQPGLSLLGMADQLAAAPEAEAPAIAASLRAESARLLRLSDEIADELASHGGERHLREEPLVLGALLDQALLEVRRPLGDASRHWSIDGRIGELTLLGDRRALSRSLAQVLMRAVRETGAGDCIAIRLVRGPDNLSLLIEDEGAGLASGDIAGMAAEAGGTRGLELGLATARDLMRAHGGDLVVEAAAGVGTRAWLTLPRRRVISDPETAPRAPAATPAPANAP